MDIQAGPAQAEDATPKVVLAEPRGFCAGVRRAIAMVEWALDRYGPPVWVRKEIVHNSWVVRELEARGARFVDSEEAIPHGAVCVFSAHGVSPAVRRNAAARRLRVLDATCPLVSKVHREAVRFARDDRTILLIGHADHEEVEGTVGEAPEHTLVVETAEDVDRLDLPADAPVAYLTQTTLSLDETAEIVMALRRRFPRLEGPASDDICYASQNRQNAIKAMAARCDLILVVGSGNSSNSNRMVEVARRAGVRAYLVPDAGHLDPCWLDGAGSVGVSSGASVPEVLVDELLGRLAAHGCRHVEVERAAEEDVVFSLPARLTDEAPVTPGPTGHGQRRGPAR